MRCNTPFLRQRRIFAIRTAPQALIVQLGDDRPVLRVDHERRTCVPVPFEIIVDIGCDEALRPRHAVEVQTHSTAHAAACPVGADHPAGAKFLRTRGRLRNDRDTAAILLETREPRVPMHRKVGHPLQALQRKLREPVLPEVDVIRMPRDRGQGLEGEGNPLPRLEDQVVVILLRKADGAGLLEQAQPLQAFEHRPVIDGRSRGVDDVRLALDESDFDSRPGESQGPQQADGTGADDQHFIFCHDGSFLFTTTRPGCRPRRRAQAPADSTAPAHPGSEWPRPDGGGRAHP